MATDAELSGPLPPETFPQSLWQTHFRAETGILGDTDGSAFSVTLPPSGDTAEIGSATIDSIAKVGGYPLTVAAGTTQSLDIPPSVSGGTTGRTDLIVARCDIPNFTTAPGPVRLHRIEGTDGSSTVPSYGVFDLPLWSVRRKQGEALNQAILTDLRSWSGRPPVVLVDGAPMPADGVVPLGTRVRRGTQEFIRQLISGAPTWVDLQANLGKYQSWTPAFNTTQVTLREARYRRIGDDVKGYLRVLMQSMPSGFTFTVPVPGRADGTGWMRPIGIAVARRGNNTGTNEYKGFVVNNGTGTITTATVIEAGKDPGGRWEGNYPFPWQDNGGTEVGIDFGYEAAS